MTIWIGRVGSCTWTYGHGKINAGEWDKFIVGLRGSLTTAPQPTTMLTVTHDAVPPNAAERKLLADLLRSGAADRIVAHALVTDSALIRGVMTALDWLVKKPFKESAFADPREAVRWLATFTPDLHVTEVVLGLRAVVPEALLMPALRAPGS
jgi:hypothetical protein